MIIGQKRRAAGGFLVPAGGEILWYGLAAAVPANWEIVTYAYDCFVVGADTGGATDTPAGSNEHFHSNPAASGEEPNHNHPITGYMGAASGSVDHYSTSNVNSAPVGHTHGDTPSTSGAGGIHAHPLSATKPTTVYPPYVRLYRIKAIRSTAFPVGGIMWWDDVIANAPGRFYICDGATHNSLVTPDLREQFVYTAAEDADVGETGGSETHVHENEVLGAAGGHAHGLSITMPGTSSVKNASDYGGVSLSAGGHPHVLSGTSDADVNHTHELDVTEAAASLPLYLMLYCLMRTE